MLSFYPPTEQPQPDLSSIRFLALDGQRLVPCEITRAALQQLAGELIASEADLLRAYWTVQQKVWALADRKFTEQGCRRLVRISAQDLLTLREPLGRPAKRKIASG